MDNEVEGAVVEVEEKEEKGNLGEQESDGKIPEEGDKEKTAEEKIPEEKEKENHNARRAGKYRQLERENARLQGRNEVLEEIARGSIQSGYAPENIDPPKRSSYNSDVEFFEASNQYSKMMHERTVEASKQTQKPENDGSVNWEKNEAKSREKHEDYDEVVYEAPKMELHGAVIEAIMSSDINTELRYAIGKDESLQNRLERMSPAAAIREIGKLEAKLSMLDEKGGKKPSNAKPPIPDGKKGSGKAASVDPYSDDCPPEIAVPFFRKKFKEKQR